MLATRIRQVRERLARTERQRLTRRKARDRRQVFTVSLVGYTNAGKSTLFNAITGAGTYAADQLFATLDTLSRRVVLAPGVELVLSDTVGFVRDLPHQLVEAFRATLDETAQADLLLHVVDASAPDRTEQIEQVEQVLAEIGADQVPQWRVWNKIDLTGLAPEVERDACGSIARLSVSARTGEGVAALRQALEAVVSAHASPAEYCVGESVTHDEFGLDPGTVDPVYEAPSAVSDQARQSSDRPLTNGMSDVVVPNSRSLVA
jgi:GTP-binding protein HflX